MDGKELASGCPHLRHSDGNWNPRHGTWYFYLELNPGPDGKRRRIRRGGFTSQEDAENALEVARCRALCGLDPDVRYTVGQYLDQWLAGHRALRRSTRKSYGEHIEYYLKPHLGHIELDQLRVAHLDEMFAAIDTDNERICRAAEERRRLFAAARQAWRSGDKATHKAARAELAELPPHRRTVGAATMQRIRATLRSALADAVRQGLATENVAKLIKLETGKRPKALVWTTGRVTAWQTAYERELTAQRERADGRAVNAFKVWVSLPRPSRVMVWTPARDRKTWGNITLAGQLDRAAAELGRVW